MEAAWNLYLAFCLISRANETMELAIWNSVRRWTIIIRTHCVKCGIHVYSYEREDSAKLWSYVGHILLTQCLYLSNNFFPDDDDDKNNVKI
jgi:hypothetical protein